MVEDSSELESSFAPLGIRKKPTLLASTSLCSTVRLRVSPALTPAFQPSSFVFLNRMPASPVRALYQPIAFAYPASSELKATVSVVVGPDASPELAGGVENGGDEDGPPLGPLGPQFCQPFELPNHLLKSKKLVGDPLLMAHSQNGF